MGFFDSVKNFFTKTVAQPAQSFFQKTVAPATSNFFSKGGAGEQILGGISKGLGTVGGIASKVLSNPLVKGGISLIAPELSAPLAMGSALLNNASKLTDINTYKGNVGNNMLEIAKQVPKQAIGFA